MQGISYILFYSFALLLMLIPAPLRHALSDGVAWLGFKLSKRYRYVVHANLELIFPKRYSDKEKDAIAKLCFKNLLREVLSVIEFYFTPKKQLQKLVRIEGLEHIQKDLDAKKPLVFISNHYNNLEVAGIGMAKITKTLHVVQKAGNVYIDRFIARSREKNGLKTIPMNKALRHLAKALKSGQSVSMIVDQSVNPDAGIVVDFFGHPAMHLTSASYLARKFKTKIVPVVLEQEAKERWVYKILPPIAFTPSDDEKADIFYLTQAQAKILETQLKKDPLPWFWCHKRFKNTLPEIYKKAHS